MDRRRSACAMGKWAPPLATAIFLSPTSPVLVLLSVPKQTLCWRHLRCWRNLLWWRHLSVTITPKAQATCSRMKLSKTSPWLLHHQPHFPFQPSSMCPWQALVILLSWGGETANWLARQTVSSQLTVCSTGPSLCRTTPEVTAGYKVVSGVTWSHAELARTAYTRRRKG